ncbi:unnamed protein product, partial [Prunus brigantina]
FFPSSSSFLHFPSLPLFLFFFPSSLSLFLFFLLLPLQRCNFFLLPLLRVSHISLSLSLFFFFSIPLSSLPSSPSSRSPSKTSCCLALSFSWATISLWGLISYLNRISP